MNKLLVIKIGGHTLDDADALEQFLKDFVAIDTPKILVHGGGKMATETGRKLGIESTYVDGRRITDAPTLDLVTMVYGGLLNKKLTARLQAHGCNAIGVTGADGNLVQATKRPVGDIDYGFAGDITADKVNTSFLHALLQQNIVPVMAPLTHGNGTMLNTNADTIASVVAIAMSKHFAIELAFCSEKQGILKRPEEDDSVIPTLNEKTYGTLKEQGVLTAGILPKLENAFSALHAGVGGIWIGHTSDLPAHLETNSGGTHITIEKACT